MQIQDYIKNNSLAIIAKPNSPKTEIIRWDNEKQALRVNVRSKPENNKANIELIKFFSKLLKKRIEIIKGFKNREKLLRIL